MNKVTPIFVQGWNASIAQLWGSGPKFTITCGSCEGTFKKRIPMIDNPGISCPYCSSINIIPVTIRPLGESE